MNKRIIFKIVSGVLLCSMIGYTVPVFAYTKDETVYSKLDTQGNNYKTIVSTHIKNNENADLIKDMSDLLNISNTSGDENFVQEGNVFTWNANKNDIYYQGDTSKQLPIECNVRYELNGEEISAKDIAGKSGNVKVILQYNNKEERTVDINGKKTKMYVPFVVVAGTIIKNDVASNIKVSSGKVIDDGTKTIVVGMAMPGLQESLGVSKQDIEIPNNIEIIMDTKSFESNSIVSFVTPKVVDKQDLEIFSKLDSIYGQVENLKSSSKQIEEGANALKDGTQILSNGTIELKKGVASAYDGATQINSEVNKSIKVLESDKSEALDKKMLDGIEKQAESSSKLTNEQINLIIAEADKGIDEKSSIIKSQYVSSAKQIAESTAIQTAQIVAKDTARQTAMQTALEIAQTTARQTAMQTAKTLNPDITKEQLEIIGNQAASNAKLTDAQLKSIGEQATKKAELTEQQKKQVILNADNGIETQRKSIETQGIASSKQIAQQTAVSVAQRVSTTTAKTTATTVARTVANEVKSTAGKKVVSQMKSLEDGLGQLTNGLLALNSGAQSLESGSIELSNGSNVLADGIKNFNEQGIQKIYNYINKDVRNLSIRLQKLTELAEDYNNFTLVDEGNESEVKFIMILDSVKKQQDSEQDKEQAILTDGQ